MKKLLIGLVLFVTVGIGYWACSDEFLERQPLNEASDVAFYRNESDAIAALNSVYDIMQRVRLWKFEINVIGDRLNDDTGVLPRPNDFPTNFLPTNGRRLSMWENLYAGVNRANIVLQRVAPIDMDAQVRDRILAEAKFLRGLYYFTLTTFFGDVPIRIEPTSLDNLAIAKSPQAEIVALIVQDLTEAKQVLPLRSEQASSDIGRATRGSATALLGKVHLYQENWAEAVAQFEEVINSGEYELNEDYLPQFQVGGDNTLESVFEVQFQAGGPGWGDAHDGSWISGWNGVTGHGEAINFGFGSGNQPAPNFVESFEEGDERRGYIVEDGDDYLGIPFDASQSETAFGHLKYIVNKNDEAGSGDSPINQHLIRYADVLLMYAEALNELNGGPTPEAYDAINAVRNRSELDDLPAGLSQQEFFDAIVQERRVELYLEGHRTWDLIRWGLGPEVLGPSNGFIEGVHEQLPIPQGELDTNPDMVQNPRYQ